ncbi:GNAT family N-acetyltransferase [Sediminispirochaeta smaragdinae]|uniref:N-acetyltransferase domain-containing protein n=1 Tax=Sediminispirochaeta smaragdinae (strain DSM 11293 / JCM 15392 / SEBR 4228) TaxID=573413 RepID=E1R140_SEDSS|nr:GNAT family N-acetyltransferase [Sediminispirochaeta smaragdinae]ADK80289.1 conserved hypothetical protein [Sediminispirochaeta smaragdinae DSM 11293]
MFDMLVRLYDLPPIPAPAKAGGIIIKRPLPSEKSLVTQWVCEHFSRSWADQVEATFSRLPVSSFIAVEQGRIMGFASYDAVCKDFFGPTGVRKEARGKRIGEILLLHALWAMRESGYAYAVIGGVGPADFYRKSVGAVPIEGSDPGIYRDLLKGP